MREEALAAAPLIVRHLIEDEDDFDVKEVDNPQSEEGWWEQIDGDANPWDYGGFFWNPIKRIIWAFEGMDVMDQLGIHAIEPDDVPVPASMTAKLDQEYPLDYVDPDGDEEWTQRTRNDYERERERIIGNYQYARASFLNERKKFPWYEIHVSDGDMLDSWLERSVPGAAQAMGISEEEFRQWPLQNQYCELSRYVGLDELGHKFEMSKREGERELGMRL